MVVVVAVAVDCWVKLDADGRSICDLFRMRLALLTADATVDEPARSDFELDLCDL